MAQAGPSRMSGAQPPGPEAPGGGQAPLILLRSKAPLPLFNCQHPLPPAEAKVGETLKLSVLRLLTGEVTDRSSTAPMTASEQLKLMTIHGWRMQMVALELRQNVLIDPETRGRIGEGVEDSMDGFELLDDLECGILEAEDEVLIRLKPAYTLADLHLPKLPPNHHYAMPPGALTRAGTLSNPPPYSRMNVKRAAEPSSHSSSVQAQPDADFHARQYRDYSKGYRVVTAQGLNMGNMTSDRGAAQPTAVDSREARKNRGSSNPAASGPSRPLGLGMGVEPPAAIPAAGTYKPAKVKQRRTSSNKANGGPSSGNLQGPSRPPKLPSVPLASPPPETLPDSNVAVASGRIEPRIPPSTKNNDAPTVPSKPERKGSNMVEDSERGSHYGSGKAAGQDAMPLTALVIGPGVQGAVGRGPSAAIGHSGQGEASSPTDGTTEYGNARAFASFTAASGEVQHREKPRRSSSNNSLGEKRAARLQARQQNSSEGTQLPEDGQILEDAEESHENVLSPSQAAVTAARNRVAAARASRDTVPETPMQDAGSEERNAAGATGVANGPNAQPSRPLKPRRKSSSKIKYDKVDLPAPPTLPPVANLAPFPSAASGRARPPLLSGESGSGVTSPTRSTVTPAAEVSPTTTSNDLRRLLRRGVSSTTQNSTQQSTPDDSRSVSPTATRPPVGRHESHGGESTGSGTKKEGRFARLAAPGLGLGAPSARRSNSKSSVPKLLKRVSSSKKGSQKDGNPGEGEGSSSRDDGALPTLGSLGLTEEPEDAVDDAGTINNNGDAAELQHRGNGDEDERRTEAVETLGPDGKKLSRGERRYLEYQRQQAAEVSRQAEAEKGRLAESDRLRKEKEKERRRKDEEARVRKEKEKWEIWQEVRKRGEQEKEKVALLAARGAYKGSHEPRSPP